MINLLMRFYDVNSGAILVDGTDIRDATRHSLRKSFGMVLQDTWLKAGTIRDNIAYGRPDASEEDVIAAAKAAHAHSFIRRLPTATIRLSPKTAATSRRDRSSCSALPA